MSRFFKKIIPLLVLILASCNKPSVSSSSELPSSETSSSEISTVISASSEDSSQTTTENSSSSSSSSYVSSEDGKKRVPLTFNSGGYRFPGRHYNTGNYGVGQWNNYNFEHYRAVKGSNALVLLPYYDNRNAYEIGGSLTNLLGFAGMNQITLTYFTSDATGVLPRLYTSETLLFEDYTEIPFSTTKTTLTIPFAPANYFRFETSDHSLTIESFTIMYEDYNVAPEVEYFGAGDDFWRLNPTTFTGPLYEGATISVPLDVVRNGSSYTVRQSKTYTYYTFDYVYNNQWQFNDVSEFAYTDPVDLAIFYSAFKTWPANYDYIGSFSEVKDVFGFAARQVSAYTRDDGYATAVPWNNVPGETYPQYYELDLALSDAYYYGERGVGRLVCWEYGFASPGYDTSPVCVYTDDHYATFSEYLNNGTFAERFNVEETVRTNYVWSAPTTLY